MRTDGEQAIDALVAVGRYRSALDAIMQRPELEQMNMGTLRYQFWRGGMDGHGNKVRFCHYSKSVASNAGAYFVWKETVIGKSKYRRTDFHVYASSEQARRAAQRKAKTHKKNQLAAQYERDMKMGESL